MDDEKKSEVKAEKKAPAKKPAKKNKTNPFKSIVSFILLSLVCKNKGFS